MRYFWNWMKIKCGCLFHKEVFICHWGHIKDNVHTYSVSVKCSDLVVGMIEWWPLSALPSDLAARRGRLPALHFLIPHVWDLQECSCSLLKSIAWPVPLEHPWIKFRMRWHCAILKDYTSAIKWTQNSTLYSAWRERKTLFPRSNSIRLKCTCCPLGVSIFILEFPPSMLSFTPQHLREQFLSYCGCNPRSL